MNDGDCPRSAAAAANTSFIRLRRRELSPPTCSTPIQGHISALAFCTMRLSLGTWLAALPVLAYAAASPGALCIYEADDTTPSQAHHPSISADTARLILASRLGVHHHHELGVVDDSALQAINDLGKGRSLFTESTQSSRVAVILADSEHGLGEDIQHDH